MRYRCPIAASNRPNAYYRRRERKWLYTHFVRMSKAAEQGSSMIQVMHVADKGDIFTRQSHHEHRPQRSPPSNIFPGIIFLPARYLLGGILPARSESFPSEIPPQLSPNPLPAVAVPMVVVHYGTYRWKNVYRTTTSARRPNAQPGTRWIPPTWPLWPKAPT